MTAFSSQAFIQPTRSRVLWNQVGLCAWFPAQLRQKWRTWPCFTWLAFFYLVTRLHQISQPLRLLDGGHVTDSQPMGNAGRRDVYLLQAQPLKTSYKKLSILGTSLVVQWLRICLAVQGVWVRSLVGELRPYMLQLPPCAATTEPACSGARVSQPWDHVLHSERFHVMPSYRASRGGIWSLTDSAATRKGTSVPESHRPDQPTVPAPWERKKPIKVLRDEEFRWRQQDRAGLLQDKGATQWVLLEERPRLGGESWSWFSQPSPGTGGTETDGRWSHRAAAWRAWLSFPYKTDRW